MSKIGKKKEKNWQLQIYRKTGVTKREYYKIEEIYLSVN